MAGKTYNIFAGMLVMALTLHKLNGTIDWSWWVPWVGVGLLFTVLGALVCVLVLWENFKRCR